MRNLVGLSIFLLAGFMAIAQIKPETIVTEMPVITTDICKKEVREQFFKQVDKLQAEVEEEITLRKSKSKTNSKGLDEQAAKNMMKQSGYNVSDADIQKMKNANKEEKQAMAMAMIQQNMNMSVDEAKKASKMNPEAQKAWAEAMSTEMMAEAQTNPEKNKAAQKNNMGMYEMAQEQSELAQKIQAEAMKFEEKLAEFNKIKEKANLEYNKCCDDIDKKYAAMVNHTLGDEYAETIRIQKESCSQNYCDFLIPKYKTLMDERFHDIVDSGDDYNRMEVLTNELAGATTGSKKEIYQPGLIYLEALKEYMENLENIP
jgi:hypothetical protein